MEPIKSNESNGLVLVVEDDESISMAIQVRLEASGFEVLTAVDVILGTELAMKRRPDFLVLDISMPGGNGFSIAERIRNFLDDPPPIAFITASALPEIRDRAIGMNAEFFEKPFDVDLLVATIRDGIRNYRNSLTN